MAVTVESVVGVVMRLVSLVVAGASPETLILAAASGLSGIVGPADVMTAARDLIVVAEIIANEVSGIIARLPPAAPAYDPESPDRPPGQGAEPFEKPLEDVDTETKG